MAESFLGIFVEECSKGDSFDDVLIRALKVWAAQAIERDRRNIVSRVTDIGKEDMVDVVLRLELSGDAVKGLMEICGGRHEV